MHVCAWWRGWLTGGGRWLTGAPECGRLLIEPGPVVDEGGQCKEKSEDSDWLGLENHHRRRLVQVSFEQLAPWGACLRHGGVV